MIDNKLKKYFSGYSSKDSTGKSLMARWVIKEMEKWAPLELAEPWDNVGLIVGADIQTADKILVALDATDEVVEEAVDYGYNFVITHHPLLITPINKFNEDTSIGWRLSELIRTNIGLYCAHTNLDKVHGGVNDCIVRALQWESSTPLIDEGDGIGLGRVCKLPEPMPLSELVAYVKEKLNLKEIRYAGSKELRIETVGICGGGAADIKYFNAAKNHNCDVYITGDLRYHGVQEAIDIGLSLIDITHYAGEVLVVPAIVEKLRTAAKRDGIEIIIDASRVDGQVFKSV